MSPKTRVLIVDDSWAVREALTTLLSGEEDFAVVGAARDGVEAISLVRALKPDMATIDVRMPGLDGLETIARIMADTPIRIVVVCGVDDPGHDDLPFRAIAAGALELIAKPSPGEPFRAWGDKLVQALRLMRAVPVVRRRPRPAGVSDVPAGAAPSLASQAGRVRIFGLAASTGGPPVLAKILGGMPADLSIPLVVAQHMSPGFLSGLIDWLDSVTPLAVEIARPGTIPQPAHAYLPPDGHDLWVDVEGRFRTGPCEGPHSPSADRLLTSLARTFGEHAGAAVLTGMGEDGAAGLLEIHRVGGMTMAQDEASCVVNGMPGASEANGATSTRLSPSAIAEAIVDLCSPAGSMRVVTVARR